MMPVARQSSSAGGTLAGNEPHQEAGAERGAPRQLPGGAGRRLARSSPGRGLCVQIKPGAEGLEQLVPAGLTGSS